MSSNSAQSLPPKMAQQFAERARRGEGHEPTVEYVRADLYDAAIQALEALTKERDELRGALKPFLGDATMELLLWGGMPDDALGTVSVCLGDFRRARAAQRSPANAE